jgi:hypothetical protein
VLALDQDPATVLVVADDHVDLVERSRRPAQPQIVDGGVLGQFEEGDRRSRSYLSPLRRRSSATRRS